VRISKVTVKNYGCFKTRSFQLGPNVNLLTASNGTGKTTLCSAIVWGLWGRHLREVDLASGASVRLEFGSTITRSLNGRGEVVELTGHSTMNKTRFSEVMMPILGEYGAWSKSLWVTGNNVANFSQGSPRDRFQYLSRIVGAAQFDVYLEKLKARYTETKGSSDAFLRDLSSREANLKRAWSDLVDTSRRQAEGFSRHHTVLIDPQVIQAELDNAKIQASHMRSNMMMEGAQLTEFRSGLTGRCKTCSQPHISKGEAADLENLQSMVASSERKYAEARAKVQAYENQLRSAVEAKRLYENLQEIINNAETDLLNRAEKIYERLTDLESQTRQAEKAQAEAADLGTLGQCVKQAKHDYLASAANAITRTTNHYLSVIGTDYVVSIDYVDEALVVNLQQGPVKTYSKLSSGQKRRVDICLCLAMSQLAATVGTVPKTAPLIIDEAFDTLDNQGVEALISLACEIAKERQVILVSHADPSAPLGPQVSRISL